MLLRRASLSFAVLVPALALLAEKPLDPAKAAATYPAADAHPAEHLTIAAEPYDTPQKIEVFRVDYLKLGVLPVRLIITNDGDRPVSLDQARILLVPPSGDHIQAADARDVERKVAMGDRVGHDIPVGPVKWHRGGKVSDSKVEEDFHDFEYAALAVEPHTTRSGFLFYDVDGLGKRPLNAAKLLVRRVADADGKELFAFEVPVWKAAAK